MKRFLFVFIALAAFVLPQDAFARKADDLQFTDTLDTPKKINQFTEALRLAPDVFVYSSIIPPDGSSVTVKGLRFNPSMKAVMETDFIASDPRLQKKLKKINRLTKPLNPVFDLTVKYENVPEGIAVAYYITNISVFGGGKVPVKSEY
ncbi:MAG: hypothetical protein Q4G10_03110 [Bacteroidia bacterium]|nr:hypothetical protein [Bacteroidia bacterium]